MLDDMITLVSTHVLGHFKFMVSKWLLYKNNLFRLKYFLLLV